MVIWARLFTIPIIRNGIFLEFHALVRNLTSSDSSALTFVGRQLKLIGHPKVTITASLAEKSSSSTQSAVTRTRNIKSLVQAYPELVPGISLLPALAQTSEAVCEVISRHDPTVSELLAFGTAINRDNPRAGAKSAPLIATASGETGEAVRLALLGKKIVGWHGNKTVGLKFLEIQGKEQEWWSGHGGPILQLRFAEGEDTSWLAVRYPRATTVLRPVLHRLTVAPLSRSSLNKRMSLNVGSRLDPNPISTLPNERTGGAPHADVSFNPWHGKQFAIVDEEGRWSVWNIDFENKRRGLCNIEAGPAGYKHNEQVQGLETNSINADGWGCVLWACNIHTLLVFSRRTFILYNLEEVSERTVGPDLAPANTGDWILSVKRSPSDNSHVFVVTSSRIFWLSITGFGEKKGKGCPEPGAKILLAWRHFRDQEDISLGISVFNDTEYIPVSLEMDLTDCILESTTLVLLYSRLTGLTTVYTFQKSPATIGLSQSTSDPYALNLSNVVDKSAHLATTARPVQQKSISTLMLQKLEYAIRPGYGSSGKGNQYMKGNVRFYQLSTLFNDLSIEQSLYASAPSGRITSIHPPDITLLAVPKLSAKTAIDRFIVPDGILDEDMIKSHDESNNIGSKERMIEEDSASGADGQWTVNFQWLERHLHSFAPRSCSLERITSPIAKSFEGVLEILQSVLGHKPNSDESGIRLLYVYSFVTFRIISK